MFKRIIASALATLMFLIVLPTKVNATSNESSDVYLNHNLTEENAEFIDKVVSVSKYYIIENNELSIALSKEELINDFGFTEEEYLRLGKDILGKTIKSDYIPAPPTRVYISNGALYIPAYELRAGSAAALVAAANAGPAALAAALTAIGTAFGGPVGTIIAGILTVAAVPSLAELCGRIIYANMTNKGIYIKPVFSYPPLEFGYF